MKTKELATDEELARLRLLARHVASLHGTELYYQNNSVRALVKMALDAIPTGKAVQS